MGTVGGGRERLFLKLINTEEAPKQVGISASDKCFFLLSDRWLQAARVTVSFQDGTSIYKQTPKVPSRTQNHTEGSGSSKRRDTVGD